MARFDATPVEPAPRPGETKRRASDLWRDFAPAPVVTYLQAVPVNARGYDRGGAYWGQVQGHLWCAHQVMPKGWEGWIRPGERAVAYFLSASKLEAVRYLQDQHHMRVYGWVRTRMTVITFRGDD